MQEHNLASSPSRLEMLASELENDLFRVYGGFILGGEELRAALGYRTIHALRQAIVRDIVPVPVFSMKNRRGKYALVKDIALYLAQIRTTPKNKEVMKSTDN